MSAACAEHGGYTGPFGVGTLVRVDSLITRVQELMELRGWTAYEFAHRAGLGDSLISNWIRRGVKRPDPEAVRKLAAAAGVRVEWLRDGEGPRDLAAFDDARGPEHMSAREHGFNDCHGDVQRVTLAALMPTRIVRSIRTLDPLILAAAAGVPYWSAWARLKMPSVVAMLRAA